MLCAKCKKNEATIHLTTVAGSEEVETVDLCADCGGETTGLATLVPAELAELSVLGKRCEFCGKEAYSGEMRAGGGAIYFCADCGEEYVRIVAEWIMSEHPEFMERGEAYSSFLAFSSDPQLRAWSAEASQRAVQILKLRRQEGGPDAAS
jgi:hypothetical protein